MKNSTDILFWGNSVCNIYKYQRVSRLFEIYFYMLWVITIFKRILKVSNFTPPKSFIDRAFTVEVSAYDGIVLRTNYIIEECKRKKKVSLLLLNSMRDINKYVAFTMFNGSIFLFTVNIIKYSFSQVQVYQFIPVLKKNTG